MCFSPSIHTQISSSTSHPYTFDTQFSNWTTNDKKNLKSPKKFQAVDEENILEPSSAGTDAILETIRVARETNILNNNQDNQINHDQETQASEVKDQQAQAAENSSSAVDELTLDSLDDEESRGKRFGLMIDKIDIFRCLINYVSKQIP